MAQPPANQADINNALEKFFRNGVGEAGLEVGADPGLPFNHRIMIPGSMRRRWVFKLAGQLAHLGTPAADKDFDLLIAQDGYEDGENFGHTIVTVDGASYVTESSSNRAKPFLDAFNLAPSGAQTQTAAQQNAADRLVEDIRFTPATLKQIAEFVEANTPGVVDANIPAQFTNMVHACRYWGTVAGWVATSKNSEYEEVATPASITRESWEIAQAVASMSSEAFTACAARCASWRKTNHCTGGETAQGLPRRWLDKNGHWSTGNDPIQTANMHKGATSAFYFGTHGISNHAGLAALAPGDHGHWSRIDPSYGFILTWSPGESVKLRIQGMTQVAGAAIVADSVEVLRMVIKERMSPLVNARDNIAALMSAYRVVESGGIAVHVGARWFLSDHPRAYAAVTFSQKDSAHFTLAAELAVIATTYYARTTIGRSMALKNAADQCSDELAKSTWASLAANRAALAAAEVIKAVARIKGAASVGSVRDMVSESEAKIRAAVAQYNSSLRADAALVQVTGGSDLEADRIVANARDAAVAEGKALQA